MRAQAQGQLSLSLANGPWWQLAAGSGCGPADRICSVHSVLGAPPEGTTTLYVCGHSAALWVPLCAV